jgi:hypothetical protein
MVPCLSSVSQNLDELMSGAYSPPTPQSCHIGGVIGGRELLALSTTGNVVLVVCVVLAFIIAIAIATGWAGARAVEPSLSV